MSHPAKRLTAARLAGIPELEEVFSDPTGLLDIWDGGGEHPPSTGPYVVRLQESLLAMGYELPRHGADGVYGAETTAAVLQFQIDAGHPLPPGHEWEHVLGIGGSNTLAHFDMFDPGDTVGNFTRAPSGVVASAVAFAESPHNPFAGFDAEESPPALVVGTRTRRRIRVELEPAEADVGYAVEDPEIATVGVTDEGIVVGGERAGTTLVRATSGGDVRATLAVCVKDPRDVVVNFFFVAGTALDREKATLLTLRLNRVWRRQANVRFTLGEVVDVDAVDAKLARPEAMNMFCAANAEPVPDGVMLLPDAACPDGMDLPHAAGRYLGSGEGGGVMSGCGSGEERRRVPKAVADVVNP